MRYGLLNVIHHDNRDTPRPMVAFYAALANPPAKDVPPPSALPRPSLFVSEERMAEVTLHLGLSMKRPLVLFAPGAEFGSAKRWPTTHFAELAKTIRSERNDAQIVLMGSPKDKEVCDEIAALAPGLHKLAGVTKLDQAVALIACAGAMVSCTLPRRSTGRSSPFTARPIRCTRRRFRMSQSRFSLASNARPAESASVRWDITGV
jgi:heptosyltransferase-2